MKEKTVVIPSISCIYCGENIKRELAGLKGVESVKVNLPLREVYIRWGTPATWEAILKTLKDIEYPPLE